MNLNTIYEVNIIGLDHQGRGMAKVDNIITFIPNTMEGEVVKIKIDKIHKKFNEASLIEIVKRSPNRIEPICRYYPQCGGCDLLHMSYPDQVKYKEDKVRNIMSRYASLDCVDKIVKCDNPLNYRNKVTFQVNNVIGPYRKKSYEVIPIDKCLLVDERINEYLKKLNKMDLNGVNQITFRVSSDDIMVIFKCDKDINIDVKELDGTFVKEVNGKFSVIKGKGYIISSIGDKKYKVSPTSFFQVNTNQVKKLYDKAIEYLELTGEEKVLDLYCGTGTIGIYLADRCKEVLGVEINEEAIKDAKYNSELNGVKNARFIAGDASKVVKELNFSPDKIVVDPPRAGLDKEVIDKIIDMNPERIVYVSCDPITLARDLNIFKDKYTVEKITPVDMFCNTMHVECVCALKRG